MTRIHTCAYCCNEFSYTPHDGHYCSRAHARLGQAEESEDRSSSNDGFVHVAGGLMKRALGLAEDVTE